MPDAPRSRILLRRVARRARGRVESDRTPGPAPVASGPSDRPVAGRIDRYRKAHFRLAKALRGVDGVPADWHLWQLDPTLQGSLVAEIKRNRSMAAFGESIVRGDGVDAAHVAAVRELAASRDFATARAFTLGLGGLPGAEDRHRIGMALTLYGQGLYRLAWARLRDVETAVLARLVPLEAAHCALAAESPEGTATALAIVEDPAALSGSVLVGLAGRFLAMRHPEVARRLVEEVDRRDEELVEDDARALGNLRRWTHPGPDPQVPAGAIPVGVMDYYQPDMVRASKNVGDYIQTLAMLGNLARFRGVRFTGEDGLGELATEVQQRIRPDLQVAGGDAAVHLVEVSRDFSEGDALPDNTWMVAFGWHMHPMFDLRHGLPYHPNVNPIFISFHVNRTQALTPEALDYLRAHGPIGCRDWTTVDLLNSAGVDAFFTGCLTTTVNAAFRDLSAFDRNDADLRIGVIDYNEAKVKARREIELLTHADPTFRHADLVTGTRHAVELLEGYQQRFKRIVTSRLHSYLPATSLGLEVSFRPNVPGDVRFDGLYGMSPLAPAFEEMRDGIRELIRSAFTQIFHGGSKDEVYAHWREITADRVAAAKARLQEEPPELEKRVDVPAVVAAIRSGARAYGPHDSVDEGNVTDIAMGLDQNLAEVLPVTIESVVENASGPLRLWVTSRGLTAEYETWLSEAFPELPITFLHCDDVDYGVIGRMIKHITVATMDRLFLPEVLADLDRITYIDIDTITEGDVCELAATDLRGLPLAARTSVYRGEQIWRLAGDLLPPKAAADLRRTMSARHPFGFVTFNAGVLVLDLARMRKDDFTETYVQMAGAYGLHDQDLLNVYVGADRVELDKRWNALPIQEVVSEAGIIHFAGAGKPWNDELTEYGERWQAYADRFGVRVTRPMPRLDA